MPNITIQTSSLHHQMARSIGVEQARFGRSLQRLGSGDRHASDSDLRDAFVSAINVAG
ncbi:MAG: hypothetical protein HOD72_06165, partial [Opitutae bacterium]|nr:hypothetical protein [Opitutae bacterium]